MAVQRKRENEVKKQNSGRAMAQGREQRLTSAKEREVVLGEGLDTVKTDLGPARKHKPKIRTIRAKDKKNLPVTAVFFICICTLLVMFLVVNYVQINEYTQEVASLKKELSTLEARRKELDLELEKKNDLTKIKEEAAALGMMEDKDLITVHVNLEKEDKIESYETEKEDFGVVTTVMSALAQNARAYWNIFSGGE